MRKYKEQIMSVVFLIAACASILAVILICAIVEIIVLKKALKS